MVGDTFAVLCAGVHQEIPASLHIPGPCEGRGVCGKGQVKDEWNDVETDVMHTVRHREIGTGISEASKRVPIVFSP